MDPVRRWAVVEIPAAGWAAQHPDLHPIGLEMKSLRNGALDIPIRDPTLILAWRPSKLTKPRFAWEQRPNGAPFYLLAEGARASPSHPPDLGVGGSHHLWSETTRPHNTRLLGPASNAMEPARGPTAVGWWCMPRAVYRKQILPA